MLLLFVAPVRALGHWASAHPCREVSQGEGFLAASDSPLGHPVFAPGRFSHSPVERFAAPTIDWPWARPAHNAQVADTTT